MFNILFSTGKAYKISDGEKESFVPIGWINGKFSKGDSFDVSDIKPKFEKRLLKSFENDVNKTAESYINIEFCKIVKESEKAILLSLKAFDGIETKEHEIWFPKFATKVINNVVQIKDKFWNEKIDELKNKHGNVEIFENRKIYENTYGIIVSFTEYVSDQSVNRMIFFPKSISVLKKSSLLVKKWLYDKKIQETIESIATNNFRASTISPEISATTIFEIINCNSEIENYNLEKLIQQLNIELEMA